MWPHKELLHNNKLSAVIFYSLLGVLLFFGVNSKFITNNWHDQQRFLLGLFFLFNGCFWIFFNIHARHGSSFVEAFPKNLVFLILVIGLLGLCSALLSELPGWALLEWSWMFSIGFAMLMIASIRFNSGIEFDVVVVSLIAFTCLCYLIKFLARYSTIFAGEPLIVADLFRDHGFINIRFFGQFQTFTLPLIGIMVFWSKTINQRVCAWIFISLWWALSFASGTRGTWLGMGVAMGAMYLLHTDISRTWARIQLYSVMVGLMLYKLLFLGVPSWLELSAKTINRLPNITSLSGRDILWMESWSHIKTYPIFGVGPMHLSAKFNGVGAHPHNFVLQIAAEWGVPAMLILVFFIILGLVKFSIQIKKNGVGDVVRVSLLASLVAAITQAIVDGVFVMPYSQALMMLMVGWSLGLYFEKKENTIFYGIHSTRAAMLGLFSLGFLLPILWITVPQIGELEQREKNFLESHKPYFNPRFWRQGWIE